MWISVRDRWCLILGASSGMGLATARLFARAGANVVGVHFDMAQRREKLEVLVEELRAEGVQAHFFNVNAASSATRAELVPRLRELTGAAGVHVLMHSLAFGTLLPFVRSVDEPVIHRRQLDMTLDVMAHSLVYWTQDLHAADLLRSGAKIFAMTSDGNHRVTRHYGAVSAAKAALEAHVRQLAVELAPSGVAVNAIRAGVTVTPSLEKIADRDLLLDRATKRNPHGRLTRPEDVAEAIVLLSGAQTSWITGNVIGVDGGETLTV